MISALSWIGVKDNALSPVSMESNVDKSIQLHTQGLITLEHSTVTILECIRTKVDYTEERHV